MNCLAKIKRQVLFAAVITSPSCAFASDDIQLQAATIFNTSCARCHEGECSGRFSFYLQKDAANDHILRYGGNLSLNTTRQLVQLLRYMKEECRFYSFSRALSEDGVWESDTLADFRAPSKQAYFIPLGHLKPGIYNLLFDGINSDTNYCIEVISSEFDYLRNDNMHGRSKYHKVMFQTNKRLEYFLRITAREPINLKRIELAASGKSRTDE